MSWSVQCHHGLIADHESIVVMSRQPIDRIPWVLVRPGKLEKPCVWILARNGCGTRRVIGMPVGHQDIAQLSAMVFEREAELLEMPRLAHAGVNQYGG